MQKWTTSGRPPETVSMAVNRRLAEIEKFWYQCLEEYGDLNNLLSSVNALVQSLRNITFVIQSHKREIPNFEEWYAGERAKLANDPIMAWLVVARNRVVKQKDLELASVARVVIKNWLDFCVAEYEVCPFTPSQELVDNVWSSLDTRRLVLDLREPVLEIEKSWRVAEFPDRDLLEVLAHCYGAVKSMVQDLLAKVGTQGDSAKIFKERDGALVSGVVPRTARTVSVDLKSGFVLKKMEIRVEASPTRWQEAVGRYEIDPHVLTQFNLGPTDPLSAVEAATSMAKKVICRDGYHLPMVHYLLEDGSSATEVIPFDDKTQQYIQIRRIAEEVLVKRATGVIFILDAWVYSVDDPATKGENLNVTYLGRDGTFREYRVSYVRLDDVVEIGQTKIVSSLRGVFWIQPIVQAWGIGT